MSKKEVVDAYKSNLKAIEELAKIYEHRGKDMIKEAKLLRKLKNNFEVVLPIIESY